MDSNKSTITKQISDLIEPVLDEMGFELVDIEYLLKSGRWVLRIFIDKDSGITIDDCARVSREFGDLIDIEEIIDQQYMLEVSSPGLNRPLKKENDFIRSIGKRVNIKTIKSMEGRANFSGYLKNYQEEILYLETEAGLITLSLSEIDTANIVYEFEN